MKKKTFYLESLGCPKNSVDSTSMGTLLFQSGYTQVENPGQAQFIIVNTCGFIQPARTEAIQILQDLSTQKKPGQFLIAAGCLPQRAGNNLLQQVSGIDGIISTRNWNHIVKLCADLSIQRTPLTHYNIPDHPTVMESNGLARIALNNKSAWLKIADGCRRRCAFCSIPDIKGPQVSRHEENILRDALKLQEAGILEVNIISQDTTDYGSDLGLKDGLASLLTKICRQTPEIPWIRILYAFPGFITPRLIEVMTREKQILPYIDIPLQHADPEILQAMHRPSNMNQTCETIQTLRKNMPNLTLRSTFIVGYPGETEEKFQTLLDFLQEVQFDRVGAFPFSFEAGTPSESLGDPIPDEVKQERVERLMLLQQNISLRKNQQWINQKMDVLIEGKDKDILIGRSFRDAPEIDGLVLIQSQAELIGQITPVHITGALPYDLIGSIAEPSSAL